MQARSPSLLSGHGHGHGHGPGPVSLWHPRSELLGPQRPGVTAEENCWLPLNLVFSPAVDRGRRFAGAGSALQTSGLRAHDAVSSVLC